MIRKVAQAGGAFLALILALYVIGFFVPSHVHLEREVVIDAPQQTVFDLVADFRQWHRWAMWLQVDPDARFTFEGEGTGQRMLWQSEHSAVGSGSQVVTELSAPNSLKTEVTAKRDGVSRTAIRLAPTGTGGTRLSWTWDIDMHEGVPFLHKGLGPYLKFHTVMVVEEAVELSLARLAEVAEHRDGHGD